MVEALGKIHIKVYINKNPTSYKHTNMRYDGQWDNYPAKFKCRRYKQLQVIVFIINIRWAQFSYSLTLNFPLLNIIIPNDIEKNSYQIYQDSNLVCQTLRDPLVTLERPWSHSSDVTNICRLINHRTTTGKHEQRIKKVVLFRRSTFYIIKG